MIYQTQGGARMPTARQAIQFPNKTQDVQNCSASAVTFHQTRDDDEEDPYTLPDPDEDDEDPYTLLDPVEVTAPQNATPTYENLPLRNLHPPIACSENQLETGSSNIMKQSGAKLCTGEYVCRLNMHNNNT